MLKHLALVTALVTALLIAPASAAVPPMTTWYWQLQGTVKTDKSAKIYDIDMADNPASLFASLKANGHTVICYLSAGTWEDWRDDASAFPTSVRGAKVGGWAGEQWLDIRSSVVRALMAKRMDLAKSKGCDGLEPDNVDGYSNGPGFPLTKADQISYNTFLATSAHERGMIVALKNATALVPALVDKFDFSIVEGCMKYKECPAYSPFIQKGKAVLEAEYSTYSATKCAKAKALKFSLAFFGLNLNGRRYAPCP